MIHRLRLLCLAPGALVALALASDAGAADSPFASRVLEYRPAPGQFVNHSQFNDPARALGAPVGGGTINPDLSSLVSLGGFGGTITLGFDHSIPNRPPTAANPRGLDLIVHGNAVYVGGNPNRRFAECAIIEISQDTNANGLADDEWYLITGSHLAAPVQATFKSWDADTTDTQYPPSNPAWIPAWAPAPPTVFQTWAFALPPALAVNVLVNPLGSSAATEGVWGYADHTPTLVLGDSDADNLADDAGADPPSFYVRPDDPTAVGISPGSGGGDAIDIDWARDPSTGAPAQIRRVDFVRLTTGVDASLTQINEMSSEIDAMAEALATPLSDYNLDRTVSVTDLFEFLSVWFAHNGQAGDDLLGDHNSDGLVSVTDLFEYLSDWFAQR